MRGKRRAVVMLKEFDPISSPAAGKWLLRVLMFCEQGEHPLVAKRDLPQFLHSYSGGSLVCPWETGLVGRFQWVACFG